MVKTDSTLLIATIARVVRLSTRHAWIVIAAFLIAAVLAGGYVTRHIAINTDSGKLLSSSLPWRQQEIKLNELFPQRTDLIVAVIDGTTPEGADEAANALATALAPRRISSATSLGQTAASSSAATESSSSASMTCGAIWTN